MDGRHGAHCFLSCYNDILKWFLLCFLHMKYKKIVK